MIQMGSVYGCVSEGCVSGVMTTAGAVMPCAAEDVAPIVPTTAFKRAVSPLALSDSSISRGNSVISEDVDISP